MDDYIATYLAQIKATIDKISPDEVHRIVEVLHQARLDGRAIFLVGNGGSAATASHWANDLCKGATRAGFPRLRAIALTDNVPLMTAWANDTAYENIFVEQLANFLQPRDVIIGISGSGNSPNVLKAMSYARQNGALTVGLTGFGGGRLKGLVELCVIVPSNFMEQIEDVHLILTHIISTSLRNLAEAGKDHTMPLQAEDASYASPVRARTRAVFIDRDGVINENRSDYVKSWQDFKFLDGSLSALARLASTPLKVVIASNQSVIGRQQVTRERIEEIHERMAQQVELKGGRLDLVLYCPHHPDEQCSCRKPKPGLLEQASRKLEIDLTHSYLIGDTLEDIEAGRAAGCTALLVRTGRGTEAVARLNQPNGSRPVVVDDLSEAVEWILAHERIS